MRKDWVVYKLNEVCKYSKGKKPKKLTSAITEASKVPYINIKAFEKGIIDEYTDGSNCNLCENEDLLMVWDGARCGMIGKALKGAVGSTLMKITPTKMIHEKYFYNYLESKFQILNTKPKGVGIPHIEPSLLWNFDFPLAPLPEQRAIVSKIELLFSELDNAVSNLKQAKDKLEIFRQSVLKKAFEGELTKDWREKHSQKLVEFLDNIKKSKNKAIKDKQIKKDDYFPEIEEKNIVYESVADWLQLPWKTITANNKHSMKRGPFGSALRKEFFVEKGYTVYEQGHAINNDPYRDRYFINEEKYTDLKAFQVKPGDMIVSCSGVTLGRICLLPDDIKPGIINQALLKIDLDTAIILKKYFLIMFRSETFQRKIFQKSLGSAMPNMAGMEELKELLIPIPSLKEQQEIVKEIETRFSVADKLAESIDESLFKAEALRQSILKKAFEGELLSEAELVACRKEADWEPAEKLLERIKRERK